MKLIISALILLINSEALAQECEVLARPELSAMIFCPKETSPANLVALVKEHSEKILEKDRLAMVQIWLDKEKVPKSEAEIFNVKASEIENFQMAYYLKDTTRDKVIFFCRINERLNNCADLIEK